MSGGLELIKISKIVLKLAGLAKPSGVLYPRPLFTHGNGPQPLGNAFTWTLQDQ